MGYGNDDGGQTHDGYPKKTAASLTVKDQSKVTTGPLKKESADQAMSLIDLVLAGADPGQVMSDTISQIDEGQGGGPYPIGSGVRINQAYTAEKVGGGTQVVKQGDTVYVVQTNLGEHGTDKMVLLSDGSTKVIVPLSALGEADVSTGPSGHEVTPASGSSSSADSKPVGASGVTDNKSAQSKGSSSASSHPSTAQGQSQPGDNAAAQKKGSGTAAGLNPSKAVEARGEIVQNIDMMLDEEGLDANSYKRVNEMRRKVEALNPERHDDTVVIAELHGMLFDKENEYAFEKLEAVIESGDRNGDDKKKNPFGGMKNAMKKDEGDNGNGNGDDKDDKDKKPNPFAKKNGNGNGKDEGLYAVPALGKIENSGGMHPSTNSTEKDKPIPQGKPGKNDTPPGLKENVDQVAAGKSVASLFNRMDEDTKTNLEGNARQHR